MGDCGMTPFDGGIPIRPHSKVYNSRDNTDVSETYSKNQNLVLRNYAHLGTPGSLREANRSGRMEASSN
jgi:hypothetical protein